MIEVLIVETGDRAEAETPEQALLAARTLSRESSWHRPTVYFLVDGELAAVREGAV